MVVPEDSELLHSHGQRRFRRYVACGRKEKVRPAHLTFEQRSLCPFKHHRNVDENVSVSLRDLTESLSLCSVSPWFSRRSAASAIDPPIYPPTQPFDASLSTIAFPSSDGESHRESHLTLSLLSRHGPIHNYVLGSEEITLACIPLTPVSSLHYINLGVANLTHCICIRNKPADIWRL